MKNIVLTIAMGEPRAKEPSCYKEVAAIQLGELAVHGEYNRWENGYTISHVRTGWRCFSARTKKQAIKAARDLQRLPVDWAFDDPSTCKDWPKLLSDRFSNIRTAAVT